MRGPLPRMLVLIGSGELAPQMTRVQRAVAHRLGESERVTAAVIDTPYAFQSNAPALSAELLDYYRRRLGIDAAVASLPRADGDAVVRERALAVIRDARFVFSGPGSPSYALRHWQATMVPRLLADKLTNGGAVVLASAAALTVGRLTVPVYEIYKGGADPHWLDGLDILSAIGIDAAVIPHYDNGEGGDHDTRYCFLGERRLRMLEEQLPDETFVLGLDEHTALVVDVAGGRAQVHGRGRLTVRRRGRSTTYDSGTDLPLAELRNDATDRSDGRSEQPAGHEESPEGPELARRVIALEREASRSGERALLAERLVATLVEIRGRARSTGDYATADLIRERLVSLGLDVHDAADGSTDIDASGRRR